MMCVCVCVSPVMRALAVFSVSLSLRDETKTLACDFIWTLFEQRDKAKIGAWKISKGSLRSTRDIGFRAKAKRPRKKTPSLPYFFIPSHRPFFIVSFRERERERERERVKGERLLLKCVSRAVLWNAPRLFIFFSVVKRERDFSSLRPLLCLLFDLRSGKLVGGFWIGSLVSFISIARKKAREQRRNERVVVFFFL